MHKKILIVDDDISVCDALAGLLREEGYVVDNTSDSQEGARLIAKNGYDVCLFDYKMKGFNGIDLLKMVKTKSSRCAVFLISGMLDIDALSKDENVVGLVADVINKPFDIDALFQKIKGS